MKQKPLFSIDDILDIKPLANFHLLFDNLRDFQLTHHKQTGRKPVLKESILNALIFKSLKSITSLTELYRNLLDNPSASLCCGFDIHDPIPSIERFSTFLKDTPNNLLTLIKNQLVHQLIALKTIEGRFLSIDSCPICAHVKENNLKTNIKNRFVKTQPPKGDPDARLGIIITFPKGKKNVDYFWGYRNHTVIDAITELPLWEITKPANVQDSTMFIPIFELLQNEFHFNIEAVLGWGTASMIPLQSSTMY